MLTKYYSYISLLVACVSLQLNAQNSLYAQRKQDYISTCLASPGGSKLVLQAYQGLPLDNNTLANKLNAIPTGVTADFDIIEMVRILYLTNGAYDAQILPVLNNMPFWINYGDTVRNYWSENHMIMWMGSDWLLHEKYGKPIDATLQARLNHYLDIKINYGFYEFFSSVYGPYCFSGIVNLADFAQDTVIKNKAILASQRLLKDFLLLTNNQGTYFPAAGRNYASKYDSPYGENHNNLIYLLTGMGQAPANASAAGAFLASSSLPVDEVINSWQPVVDTVCHIGHTLAEGFVLNSGMVPTDKTVFQWSSGAYFHPDVVLQTATLLNDSNLWHQVDFSTFESLSSLPPSGMLYLSNSLNCISESSVICGQDVAVYKHNSITLSSIQDFWKGKVGFQQYPCVANIGRSAVYTGSGQVLPDWNDRSANNQNSHLPYVEQHKNLALLMYRPQPTDASMGEAVTYKEVALHWPVADFDEVAEDGNWLLGRQDENYVAVRRFCNGQINGLYACPTVNGQSWVVMVGDSGLYNDFTNFKDIVHQSSFSESWYYDSLTQQSVYYAQIIMGGDTIDYAWGVDSATVGLNEVDSNTPDVMVYPNPATANVNVTANGITLNKLELYNATGQLVYQYAGNIQTIQIPVSTYAEGLYTLKTFCANGRFTAKRLIVAH